MTHLFAIIDAPIIAVIVGLAVLLFGADRLPKLARSMGQAKKEFEAATRGPSQSGENASTTGQPPANPPSQTPAPPQ